MDMAEPRLSFLVCYNAYSDLLLNDDANRTLAEFIREKMRARVQKPEIAEKLMPDYRILTRRLAGDTQHCETFDRDNVSLVDVRRTPIERFTRTGIQVDGEVIELDAVIFATGFNAQTGAMDKVDIRGRGGLSLKQHWSGGMRTYLGMMSVGFPNLFWMNGPGSPFFNPILQAEYQGDWIARSIDELRQRGRTCIEPKPHSEEDWVNLTNAIGNKTLFPKSNNYYMGDNIPGKPRAVLFYFGGFPSYTEQCEEAAAKTYDTFALDRAEQETLGTDLLSSRR